MRVQTARFPLAMGGSERFYPLAPLGARELAKKFLVAGYQTKSKNFVNKRSLGLPPPPCHIE